MTEGNEDETEIADTASGRRQGDQGHWGAYFQSGFCSLAAGQPHHLRAVRLHGPVEQQTRIGVCPEAKPDQPAKARV